ncbi:4-carboxymuconolactone decarboxylase [Streptacidiphilus sp. EB129]|uniref:bifunctional 3-oxoadipate enol-lactonase/4-carboxymuconolactone decarboxylase PcaDC n=1 Tax=Streptacidiphilus sp. EB129 TaxID=3156262 RepID=UPI0035137481
MTSPVLHHRVDGAPDAEPLLLGPSLGTSLTVWDPQVPALARSRRVVRWDLPGHGGSPADLLPTVHGVEAAANGGVTSEDASEGVTTESGATVADLARLVLDLADSLGIGRFAYAGVSLGGAVGLWLAVHHPERLSSLALVCASAHFGDPGPWHERAALVRKEGTGPLADAVRERWFTPNFTDDTATAGMSTADTSTAGIATALVDDLRAADPVGYAACCDALAGYDLRADLHRVTVPTLVVAGREDPATPPAHARELADGIPAASLTEVAGAAHLAGVERPGPVLAALLDQLAAPDGGVGGDGGDGARYAAGMRVRRAVLGDAHVDRASARSTGFTAPFQDFITRYAWGEIWTRPGLDRRTRSCVTLTALVAGGHHEELAMHLCAALRNGLTSDEIQEVLLQSAVYCGVPAANAAFAIADRILREEET